MTNRDKLRIRAYASQNYYVDEIADKVGLEDKAVADYMKDLGYRVRYRDKSYYEARRASEFTAPQRHGRITAADRARIWQLHDWGFAEEDIARMTGRQVRTVFRVLAREANRNARR